jgi:hypothetical protein
MRSMRDGRQELWAVGRLVGDNQHSRRAKTSNSHFSLPFV